MNWYGVKTIYRTVAEGRPRGRDESYDGSIASVEERIVLFRARSAESALKRAETEARRYAKAAVRTNAYGQSVRTEFLEAAESCEILDEPHEGTEVFSSLETVPRRETTQQIVSRKMPERPGVHVARQFISGAISGGLDEALGVGWRRLPKRA